MLARMVEKKKGKKKKVGGAPRTVPCAEEGLPRPFGQTVRALLPANPATAYLTVYRSK